MKYARITRFIHLFLALFITLQLAGGELMVVPGSEEGDQLANVMTPAMASASVESSILFEMHEYIGLFLVFLVLVRWVWGFMWRGNANWHILFLWLLQSGRKELADDLKRSTESWMKGKLPEPSERDAMSKTLHGFLVLTATGMVLTGLILYFGWNEQVSQSVIVDWVGETHETFAGILWTLLGGMCSWLYGIRCWGTTCSEDVFPEILTAVP